MSTMQSLCEFLADQGGIRLFRGQLDTVGSGELRAIQADAWHRDRPFRRKLVRVDSGLCPDDAALAAWEAGYFGDCADRPDIGDLIDAIDRELGGEPVYTLDDQCALWEREIEAFSGESRAEFYGECDMQDIVIPEPSPAAMASAEGRRAIPEGSVRVDGVAGRVAYLYGKPYKTRKGREGVQLYAKVFQAGCKVHDWHKGFASEAERAAAVAAFLQGRK